MRTLRVNETTVTSKNGFTDNIFAFESQKETENDKTSLFWDYSQIIDLDVSL